MKLELPQSPATCMRCGAPSVVPIVYGLPGPELEGASQQGLVQLGGCIVPQPQRWSCRACGYSWPLPTEVLARDLVSGAFAFAAAREDLPYLERPVEVAHMLWEEGYPEEVVAAALLGDVIEDCDVAPAEIERRFGATVAYLVVAVTADRRITDYDNRRLVARAAVIASGRRAAAIYAADRLATVRGLRTAYTRDGECLARRLGGSFDERVVNFERDIRMLERFDPKLPFVAELDAEVKELRSDRVERRRAGKGDTRCKV